MKKVFSCVIFCLLTAFLVQQVGDVLTPKSTNRYYMLEKYLEDHPEQYEHDVQIFGSCHTYTSFNPIYLEQRTGVSAFVFGNAGEIIPTTYVRMAEQFKKHIPKVVLIDIWGIYPHESPSSRFGDYLANNLERTALSKGKIEVIADYKGTEHADIDNITMNFPIAVYKDRILDGSLTDVDFDYSFEGTRPHSSKYNFNEMSSRFQNNGFKENPATYVEDYPEKQNYVNEDEIIEIEPDIVKYIQKIIDLCRENEVELIFYRSPYVCKTKTLRKLNHFKQISEKNGVPFIDLEAELQYNYRADFTDYEHLSTEGANRSTEFLIPYILEALEKQGETHDYSPDLSDSMYNGDFIRPINSGGLTNYIGATETVDGWHSNDETGVVTLTVDGIEIVRKDAEPGWQFYQVIEDAAGLQGRTMTAVFDIDEYNSETIRPIISCRNAGNSEIHTATAKVVEGEVAVSCAIPEETEYIRVGFYSYEGTAEERIVTVESIRLYDGAYTRDPVNG